jgi:predicted secreted protein
MATLKGQNFRILTYDAVASKFKCVGMATNCTVNLTANTDDASTKDDIGGAQKPTVTNKSWQVSVESLSVADIAAILTAIKSYQKFTLLWDEVSTVDNQLPLQAGFARTGSAYLNDVTFNFNDRENASKSLQFTGVGQLAKVTTTPAFEPIAVSSTYTKGQFVRLFLGSDNTATPAKVIASAKSLSLHVSLSLEDATTKDTDGNWQVQEPTGISFDISSNALVRSGDAITSTVQGQALADLMDVYEASEPVKFQIANVSGANQRTKGAVIVEGSVVITALNISAQNRQNATYDATLTGYGEYTVGEDPAES